MFYEYGIVSVVKYHWLVPTIVGQAEKSDVMDLLHLSKFETSYEWVLCVYFQRLHDVVAGRARLHTVVQK